MHEERLGSLSLRPPLCPCARSTLPRLPNPTHLADRFHLRTYAPTCTRACLLLVPTARPRAARLPPSLPPSTAGGTGAAPWAGKRRPCARQRSTNKRPLLPRFGLLRQCLSKTTPKPGWGRRHERGGRR